MDDDLNYETMRERVERRVRKRAEFLLHLTIYVPVNVLMWIVCIVIFGPTQWLVVPMIITFGWTIGLIGHGMDTYLQTGALDKMREREMRREISLERMRRGLDDGDEYVTSEKRKREPIMRLSDDGELESSDGDNNQLDQDSNAQRHDQRSSPSRSSTKR